MANVNFRLPFTIESQYPRDNWCWAATAKSVYSFYFPGSTRWSQCKIAKKVLNSTTCCTDPSSCDIPDELDKALIVTKNFVTVFPTVITWDAIRAEIMGMRRLVCARIAWNDGGAHFVTIYGVKKNGAVNRLYIGDPLYGEIFQTYNTFKNRYSEQGDSWTHTYHTDKTMPAGS